MIGVGTCLLAAAMTAPSFAEKKVVSDDELDMVTAAGQPVIISVTGNSDVTFAAAVTFTSANAPTGSQTGLRALVLNNIVGENQVQNGINITSTIVGGGSQTNIITQSWGSVRDLTAAVVDGVTVGLTPDCTGSLICKPGPVVSAAAGVIKVLSHTADVIIEVGGGSDVTYSPQSTFTQQIAQESQTDLVALVVNNVVGMNQVGNGVNLLSGGAGGISLNGGITVTAGNVAAGSQGNILQGYRGTPQGFVR
jgi:hypothetical protein